MLIFSIFSSWSASALFWDAFEAYLCVCCVMRVICVFGSRCTSELILGAFEGKLYIWLLIRVCPQIGGF